MKVFIGWSGERSKALAAALHAWLPLELQYLKPWMSDKDIEAGARWDAALDSELETTRFGIICLTRERLSSPWVLFEAGALAKPLQESRVVPLLLGLELSDLTGPLAHFQAKKADAAGVLDVILSINRNASDQERVPEINVSKTFELFWPQLETAITAIPPAVTVAETPLRTGREVLEELVTNVRSLEAQIRELPARMTGAAGAGGLAGMLRANPELVNRLQASRAYVIPDPAAYDGWAEPWTVRPGKPAKAVPATAKAAPATAKVAPATAKAPRTK